MNEKEIDDIIWRLKNQSQIIKEDQCLTCNSVSPNWIIFLKLLLEKNGVDVEKFCDLSKRKFWWDEADKVMIVNPTTRLCIYCSDIRHVLGRM